MVNLVASSFGGVAQISFDGTVAVELDTHRLGEHNNCMILTWNTGPRSPGTHTIAVTLLDFDAVLRQTGEFSPRVHLQNVVYVLRFQ